MKRIEKLKKQSCLLNTMDDFKRGDRVMAIEARMKETFGRNHNVNCNELLIFIAEYGQATAEFKTPGGDVITLKINNVKFV